MVTIETLPCVPAVLTFPPNTLPHHAQALHPYPPYVGVHPSRSCSGTSE